MKAAALVYDAASRDGWMIPTQVPELVRSGYDANITGPAGWRDDVAEARAMWDDDRARRRATADRFVLAGPGNLHRTDLAGLHVGHTRDLDDDAVAAVVRDGPETIEVAMLRRIGDRRWTLDGQPLGPNDAGISVPEVADAVMRSAVRLPSRLTAAALRDLHPLVEAAGDPWLSRARVLELDDTNQAVLGGRRLTYDHELGLRDEAAS